MNGQTPMSSMPELYAGDRKRQILIVEDEYVSREILNAHLENDYELLFAETGAEALEIIHAHSETLPDHPQDRDDRADDQSRQNHERCVHPLRFQFSGDLLRKQFQDNYHRK